MTSKAAAKLFTSYRQSQRKRLGHNFLNSPSVPVWEGRRKDFMESISGAWEAVCQNLPHKHEHLS